MRALGADPSPFSRPEVYMALQQKAFDGQENSIPIIYVHKIYKVQKFSAITNRIYEPMSLVISEYLSPSLIDVQKNSKGYSNIS